MPEPRVHDIAVVGSGFAGSIVARIARRLGFDVLLLERARHPRFAIGESATPLANLLMEELGNRYNFEDLVNLSKWGTWQEHHPEIGCGLKRGFSFLYHQPGERFAARQDRSDQLMVAASPSDHIADMHWYRPDFDTHMMEQARAMGVDYCDRVELGAPTFAQGVWELSGQRPGNRQKRWRARYLVDASGIRGLLHRSLGEPESRYPGLPATRSLFSHFRGVRRLVGAEHFPFPEGTPYPVDDAALHHVFPGGWVWVLRFANGITSAGIAATEPLAAELALEEGEPAWRRLLSRYPTLGDQFAKAKATVPFVHLPNLSYRSQRSSGAAWYRLPSSAGFVDPLLSTGFALTLLGIRRFLLALEDSRGNLGKQFDARVAAIGARSLQETDAVARLIAALYATMDDFALFRELAKLYFAAASFGESARRLGKPALTDAFLCIDRPDFAGHMNHACDLAIDERDRSGARAEILSTIQAALAPIDIAGLTDPARNAWYPVIPADLLAARHKLHSTESELCAMLSRCGIELEVPDR